MGGGVWEGVGGAEQCHWLIIAPHPHFRPSLPPNPGAGALNSASGAEVALSSGPRGASDSPRLVNFLVSHWPERPVASSPLPGEKKITPL